jgi:hypothetical protein
MRAKSIRSLSVFLFAVCLIISSLLTGAYDFPPMLQQLSDAMVAVKRLDNMEYTYQCDIFSGGETRSMWIDVLYDQLTGAFAADYYERDEDGTRHILREVYDADRGIIPESGNTAAPYIDLLTYFDFDLSYVTGINSFHDDGMTAVCLTLDPSVNLKELADDPSALIINDVSVTYMVDSCNILCSESALINMMSDQDGSVSINATISVSRYNSDDILAKIRSL